LSVNHLIPTEASGDVSEEIPEDQRSEELVFEDFLPNALSCCLSSIDNELSIARSMDQIFFDVFFISL
jgi:hypothetical protein